MNEVHLNQNPKISEFKICSGLDGSVASPPMTLLDHNVDEFPRAYWTYSPRDLKTNHSFDRTVTNWGPCHDNKIEVLLFQRPSQNMEQKYRYYLRLWTDMKCEANKLCCCWSFFTYKPRQYQKYQKHSKNPLRKKNSHEAAMSKKTHRIGAIFKFHGSTPETRNSFLNPKTMKAQKSNNQGLWIVFDVVIIPQERYFSSNAVAKTIFLQIIYLFVKLIYTEIILFDVVRFNGLCHSFRIFIYLLSLNLGWMSDLRSRPF